MPATKKRTRSASPGKRKAASTVGSLRRPKSWMPASRVIELASDAVLKFPIIAKLDRILAVLSLSAAADILGIDKSQLKRCSVGEEKISTELTRRIMDLEFVIDRALQVMNPEQLGPWLRAPEPLLGNSIPLNVLALAGPSTVIRALDGIGAGVFA